MSSSLTKTLLKVALGVAVAKGVSTLAKKSGGGSASGGSGGGLGDLLGGMLGGGNTSGNSGSLGRTTSRDTGRSSQSGGLGDIMGDILGNSGNSGTRSTRTARGGDLLEEVLGTSRTSSRKNAPGGLGDVLEQMTGARTGRGGQASAGGGGGIGDLLGSILGGAAARPAGNSLRVEEEDEVSAALMLKAIIQAVKCDGELDAAEKKKLMEAMGDASQSEVQAVNAELSAPVDVDALVRMVPNGLEAQVYLASLSAIDLDNQAEAQYLHALAQGLELQPHEVNALHDRIGAPKIYR